MKIIPKAQGNFQEMWEPLRELQSVAIPYCKKEDLNLPAEGGCAVLVCSDSAQIVSRLAWKNDKDERFGILVTDPRLIDSPYVYLEVSPLQALERYFHSTRELSAVVFNGPSPYLPKSIDLPFGWAARTFFLPRLIGMLQSEKPFSEDISYHAAASVHAIQRDQICTALHHAALLRELDGNIAEYYYSEAEALFYLSLHGELESYFNWYEAKAELTPRHNLLKAKYLTITRNFTAAEKLLLTIPSSSELEASLLLEKARLALLMGQIEKAIDLFSESIFAKPDSYDAWLGKGIALRSQNYESGDPGGLAQALMCFQSVIAFDGYHCSEALHHAGTVHGRLQDWGKAEECYIETLKRRESPVSRRNLVLALAAQKKMEQAQIQYQTLLEIDARMSEGLEKYLQPRIVVTDQAEFLNKKAAEATAKLKEWSIPVEGDILDFRRLDEYLSYHAPGGEFLESTAFHGLTQDDVAEVILLFSLHLAGVLVNNGHATWIGDSNGNLYNTAVALEPKSVFPSPLALFTVTYNRLLVGAQADNLSNLDFLVSLLPEYLELSQAYKSPIKLLPCNDKELEEYRKAADSARKTAAQLGFSIKGDISDLAEMDRLIEKCFAQDGQPANDDVWNLVPQPRMFIIGLGICLGQIWKSHTEATWYSHPSLQGLSLRGEPLNPFYPVQRIWGRISAVGSNESLSDLKTLEYSLVSCDLIRKVTKNELATRDEVAKLLKAALPSVMEEDPSGKAIDRMVTLISAQAGKPLT